MPLIPPTRDWSARIEELCSLIVRRPELAWLWEIRIKVLQYLMNRYGEAESSQSDSRGGTRRASTVKFPTDRRRPACSSTRRSQIRALLENIHRVNRKSKARTAH